MFAVDTCVAFVYLSLHNENSQASDVVDLTPLPPSLMHLNLCACGRLRDVTPLSRLKLLQTLNLRNCWLLTAGSASLLGCSSLRDLDVTNCRGLRSEDLTSLAAWTQLERLVMPDSSCRTRGLPVAGPIEPLLIAQSMW